MSELLTQYGAFCLALDGFLILVSGVMVIAPLEKKPGKRIGEKLGPRLYTLIASVLLAISLLLGIFIIPFDLLMVDIMHKAPGAPLNGTLAVLLGIAAATAFFWSVRLGRKDEDGRWLNAAQALLLVPVLGFQATTLWLFAIVYGNNATASLFAKILAGFCFVGVFVVAEFALLMARRYVKDRRPPTGNP